MKGILEPFEDIHTVFIQPRTATNCPRDRIEYLKLEKELEDLDNI